MGIKVTVTNLEDVLEEEKNKSENAAALNGLDSDWADEETNNESLEKNKRKMILTDFTNYKLQQKV